MSASWPTPPASIGGRDDDPSMQDILASIRRILNEDESQGGSMPGPDKVLQLDRSMMVPEPVAQPAFAPPAVALVAPRPDRDAVVARAGVVPYEAAAAQSVGSPGKTPSVDRPQLVHSGGPTIEDVVRDAIRPMLKDWLDTNLPPLVERLVRAEIERVVGRAVP
jgi:uncharacterized protein